MTGTRQGQSRLSDVIARVFLDAERELFFQRDHELEGINRIESEPLSEQRHVVGDTPGGEAFEMELVDQKAFDPLHGRGVVRHNVGSRVVLKGRRA